MPYILPSKRPQFDKHIESLVEVLVKDSDNVAGNLNYIVSKTIKEYLKVTGLDYRTATELIGTLTNVQFEFYRKDVAPYEDEKIEENGDI